MTAAAAATSASRSRPATGRTWIVTSRPTSDCQSLAVPATSMAAPAASAARKVIMATTAVSDRPAIESPGTMGVGPRRAAMAVAASRPARDRVAPSKGSLVDMQSSLVQHQTAGIVFVHERDIVRGDNDRGPRSIELNEEPQQPLTEIRIDIAGRLVGEQQLWPCNHGAGDCGPLFLASRQHRGGLIDALRETDPLQELDDFAAIGGLLFTEYSERQGHIFISGQVIEQTKILENDADAAAQRGAVVLRQCGGIPIEHGNQTARRLNRKKQQTQQRRLAGAGGAGKKLKRVAVDMKTQVAQDLRAEAVAQADILKSDHAVLRKADILIRPGCAI